MTSVGEATHHTSAGVLRMLGGRCRSWWVGWCTALTPPPEPTRVQPYAWEASLTMRPRTTLKWLGCAAFVLALAGSALAQPSSPPAPDAQVGFERRARLSPQDELTQAEVGISRMEQIAGTVRRQLEAARAA